MAFTAAYDYAGTAKYTHSYRHGSFMEKDVKSACLDICFCGAAIYTGADKNPFKEMDKNQFTYLYSCIFYYDSWFYSIDETIYVLFVFLLNHFLLNV